MDNSNQWRLQELLIDLAQSDHKVDEEELDVYIEKFKEIYNGNFRHQYSGIFGVITRIDAKNELSLDILQENIRFIYEKTKGDNGEEKSTSLCNNLEKLYDHVNLDISRINYTKEIAARMEEKNQATNNDLRHIREKAENIQKDHVTILGIFSSIVITFVAGMVFSSSVLSNIDKASIYRLSFIMILIALMIFNLLNLLLEFIDKINSRGLPKELLGKDKASTIVAINSMLFLMLLLDIVLWLYYWWRFL